MPVQMIELEEVTMVETSDESLESVVGELLLNYTGGDPYNYAKPSSRPPMPRQIQRISLNPTDLGTY